MDNKCSDFSTLLFLYSLSQVRFDAASVNFNFRFSVVINKLKNLIIL